MITILDKIDRLLGRILLVLSGAAVLALMLLATGNVVLRIFHAPFRGTYEIVSFLGAIGVAFALASTQRRKGHIVVDILSSRYPRPVKRLVDALSAAISAVFFGIVAWQVLVWGTRIMAAGEVSETLKVVYHPFVFGVAAGFGLLTLTCLLDIPRAFRKDGRRRHERTASGRRRDRRHVRRPLSAADSGGLHDGDRRFLRSCLCDLVYGRPRDDRRGDVEHLLRLRPHGDPDVHPRRGVRPLRGLQRQPLPCDEPVVRPLPGGAGDHDDHGLCGLFRDQRLEHGDRGDDEHRRHPGDEEIQLSPDPERRFRRRRGDARRPDPAQHRPGRLRHLHGAVDREALLRKRHSQRHRDRSHRGDGLRRSAAATPTGDRRRRRAPGRSVSRPSPRRSTSSSCLRSSCTPCSPAS